MGAHVELLRGLLGFADEASMYTAGDCVFVGDVLDSEKMRKVAEELRSKALSLLDTAKELGLPKTEERLRNIAARLSALASCRADRLCINTSLCHGDLNDLLYALMEDMAEKLDKLDER